MANSGLAESKRWKIDPPEKDLEAVDEELTVLMPQEALHLALGNQLTIFTKSGNRMNMVIVWRHFCADSALFAQRFAAYLYYSTQGWIVKCGAKFGADFVLYSDDPSRAHSAYLVVVTDQLEFEYKWIVARVRVATQAKKVGNFNLEACFI